MLSKKCDVCCIPVARNTDSGIVFRTNLQDNFQFIYCSAKIHLGMVPVSVL